MNKIITIFLLIINLPIFSQVIDKEPVKGIDWVLQHGRIYRYNYDTEVSDWWSHFGPNKRGSSLDIYGGSFIKIDSIFDDKTTWRFENDSLYIDGVASYRFEEANIITYRVYGLENGSARIIEFKQFKEDTAIRVQIHTSRESDGRHNYWYTNVLTFTKKGFGDIKLCEPHPDLGEYMGTWFDPEAERIRKSNSLIGTKWVVTRYDKGMTPVYPNDTIHFINNVTYTINGGSPRNYNKNDVLSNNYTKLNLYLFSTLGGDYHGNVLKTFVEDGKVENATFKDVYGKNEVHVWMKRIN